MGIETNWNPWHGCHKLSEGCRNCYVYRMDARNDRDASQVGLTGDYLLPIRKKRDGSWKVPEGSFVWTCFTSDFLLEDGDAWRSEAWEAIRRRPDCDFLFITKRIHRLHECLPPDWGNGWENVRICCTCENQARADDRLPIFRDAPIRHKSIVCEPLLGPIDLAPYLGPWVEQVALGGESGTEARVCDYDWVLDIRRQCVSAGVPFQFRQTGARLKKDGKIYRIERRNQHSQAQKAGINYSPPRR
jgi:protein gp37